MNGGGGVGHITDKVKGAAVFFRRVFGFLGEYDALPGLSQKAACPEHQELAPGAYGQGCGHNNLGAGALGRLLSDTPDRFERVVFYLPAPLDGHRPAAAEARLLDLVERYDVDLVVLARFMQVLSDDLCKTLEGRAINIHHSMLPSFKGARPYHQAHARGVKLIGATAHYVTAELDAGPIIEQEVARVDHRATVEDMRRIGRYVERQVLAQAVTWHVEDRVIVDGEKTIVFA